MKSTSLIKSPLRYPGGKSRAAKKLFDYVPSGTKTLCSPFFGGGSFEIYCAQNGIQVRGYDVFESLVFFWQELLNSPKKLADKVATYKPGEFSKEQFYNLQKSHPDTTDPFMSAVEFYVLNRTSFSGSTLSGGMANYKGINPRFTESSIERIRNFKVKNIISVEKKDFTKSINLKKHKNDLLYLVAAGVAAVGASGIVTALIAGAVDDSLWRDMRKDFISVFFSSSFLFGFVVALLSSFLVGGILLMLIGRRSFYWERGVSVSEGAFLIQMGAAPSLFAVILLVAWVSGWWLFDGLVPLRAIIYSSDIVLLSLSGVLVVGVVVLVEMLASVLKKKGNAPRTSFAVAVLLFVTVFSATSLFGMPDSPGALGQSQKASKAMKQNLPGAR